MFPEGFALLMSRLGAPAREAARELAESRGTAFERLPAELTQPPLSERLADPVRYLRVQQARRLALESRLTGPADEKTLRETVDLICAICEEATWSANPEDLPFDDENHPQIDFFAAETALLLSWTIAFRGEALHSRSARIPQRIISEIRQRVLRPVSLIEDYAFLTDRVPRALSIVCDIVLTTLMVETDETRAGRLLKNLLRRLDELCRRHSARLRPMADNACDIASVTDLCELLRAISDGRMSLRRLPEDDWLDELLFPWIHDAVFADPAGGVSQPELSGIDLMRVARSAGDEALFALGAMLFRRNDRRAQTVNGRLLAGDLDRQAGQLGKDPPRLRYAVLSDNRLMVARIPGLTCAINAVGGRANAGDMLLYTDDTAVLAEGGAWHSVPVINGRPQLPKPGAACVADFETRDDRESLTVDLTPAYPAEAALQSYHRTVMVLNAERAVRLVEAVSCTRPVSISFPFVTEARPVLTDHAARLGAVRMTWEGDLEARVSSAEHGLSRVVLSTRQDVAGGYFSFNFERDT